MSELWLELMATSLQQFWMVLLSTTKLAMLAGRMPVVEMLPVTCRFLMVAPLMQVNGATQSPEPLKVTLSVWPLPSKVPLKE